MCSIQPKHLRIKARKKIIKKIRKPPVEFEYYLSVVEPTKQTIKACKGRLCVVVVYFKAHIWQNNKFLLPVCLFTLFSKKK